MLPDALDCCLGGACCSLLGFGGPAFLAAAVPARVGCCRPNLLWALGALPAICLLLYPTYTVVPQQCLPQTPTSPSLLTPSCSCYAVYNAALFWNQAVRREYSCTHGGSLPAVHANDVFFAIHAAVVTCITLVQCAIYDRGGQRISWAAGLGTGGALAGVAAYLAAVLGAAAQQTGGGGSLGAVGGPVSPCGTILSWLSFLYFLSYIKLAVSLVKYIPQVRWNPARVVVGGSAGMGAGPGREGWPPPLSAPHPLCVTSPHSLNTPSPLPPAFPPEQVYLNYRLRSTAGWNMHNVALDFSGGLLSLVQLVIDGAATRDWTAVTGGQWVGAALGGLPVCPWWLFWLPAF